MSFHNAWKKRSGAFVSSRPFIQQPASAGTISRVGTDPFVPDTTVEPKPEEVSNLDHGIHFWFTGWTSDGSRCCSFVANEADYVSSDEMSVHQPGANHNGHCFHMENLLRTLLPLFSDALFQIRGLPQWWWVSHSEQNPTRSRPSSRT